MLNFDNDYSEGAHPLILQRLMELNFTKQQGYGSDEETAAAKTRIRAACGLAADEGDIYLLSGGTQTNMVVLSALLHPTEGVIAAQSGHISVHEAGAIEASGHKVLALHSEDGKLYADHLAQYLEDFARDANGPHMVQPGAVYISQPTEYGLLYSNAELTELSRLCHAHGIKLYVDGARLAYALASAHNDVSLKDLAALCDAFYIGGTKCGALLGEAVVFPRETPRGFFTYVKQKGALMAKGFVLGTQFNVLFKDDLYLSIGRQADELAQKVSAALEAAGYELKFPTVTNQIFVVMTREQGRRLTQQVQISYWEPLGETHDLWRIALSFATTPEQADALIAAL